MYRNKNGYYYLNKKIKGKVVKISLKTKDLQESIFRKEQVLKDLLNRNLSLNITINKDKNDSVEDIENFEERLKEFLSKEKKVKKQEIKTPTTTKKLIECFNEFLDYKLKVDKVSVSSLKNYKSSLNYLLLFTKDIELGLLDKKFFFELQTLLCQIPSNLFKYKEFKNLKPKEIISLNIHLKYPILNTKTINNFIVIYKNFFEFCIKKDYIDINPLQVLELLKEEKSKKVEFNQNDLIKIFNDKEVDKEILDFCLFGLFTGMRINEIITLTQEDIKNGFILVKDAKTPSGTRKVPIHPKIQNLGVFVENRPYLFFNTVQKNRQNVIGKRINRFIQKIVMDPTKTYHSFRKCFVQELYKNRVENLIIKVIVGHSTNSDITFTTYNLQKVQDDLLIETINKVDFILDDILI